MASTTHDHATTRLVKFLTFRAPPSRATSSIAFPTMPLSPHGCRWYEGSVWPTRLGVPFDGSS